MEVSLNYCSQNGGNVYRDPYYNGNPSIGPRTIGNLDQYPHAGCKHRGRKPLGSPHSCGLSGRSGLVGHGAYLDGQGYQGYYIGYRGYQHAYY